MIRKILYFFLSIGIIIIIWYYGSILWDIGSLMHGETFEYDGEKVSERLQYWHVPEVAQLAGEIKGYEYRSLGGSILWFNFVCNEASFDKLCSVMIAERETLSSDSGVMNISSLETGTARYTIIGGRTSSALPQNENAPEWWPKPNELSGMRVVELNRQPAGGDCIYYCLYYSVERKNCWLSIGM